MSAAIDYTAMYETESGLAVAVSWYLRQRGDVLLTPVEAADARGRGKTTPGSADLQGCVLGGVHLECELKSRLGQSRKKQKERARTVRRLGGVYWVCRCVNDVHDAIEYAIELGKKEGNA